jgi:hypothetical protein
MYTILTGEHVLQDYTEGVSIVEYKRAKLYGLAERGVFRSVRVTEPGMGSEESNTEDNVSFSTLSDK